MKHDVRVLGGTGHVDLPQAIALASAQWRTFIDDTIPGVFSEVRGGPMALIEEGGEPRRRQVAPPYT